MSYTVDSDFWAVIQSFRSFIKSGDTVKPPQTDVSVVSFVYKHCERVAEPIHHDSITFYCYRLYSVLLQPAIYVCLYIYFDAMESRALMIPSYCETSHFIYILCVLFLFISYGNRHTHRTSRKKRQHFKIRGV